jgi:hypothetical protein
VTPSDGTPSVGYALTGAEATLPLTDDVDPEEGIGFTDWEREVNDSVTPSDALGRSLVTPSDDLGVVDGTPSVGIALSGAENALSVSDNVTPVLNPAGGTSWTRDIDDSVTITDSGAMFNYTVSIAETDFSISDNVTPLHTPGGDGETANIDDSVSVSDGFARVVGYNRTINDSVTTSDGVSPQTGETERQINDSVTTSDGMSFARTITITDTVGIDDSQASISTFSRTVPDTVAISDNVVTAATKELVLGDTVGLADLRTSTGVFARQIGDEIFVSDSVERQKNGVVIVDPGGGRGQQFVTIGRF